MIAAMMAGPITGSRLRFLQLLEVTTHVRPRWLSAWQCSPL